MRIFYLCPDFATPSGGVKRLYTHVEILKENGYDAYIMHYNKGIVLDWFESDAPVMYFSDSPQFDPEDVIVIPEGFSDIMKQFEPLPNRKVVIAVSFAYIFESMPLGENWKDYGIDWVITNSASIADFVKWSMGIENVDIIGTSIDHELFGYDPDIKKLQIAYIKRKDTISPMVEKILKSADASFGQLDFIPIENLNIADYAQVLKESEVFLTTSTSEGFPRSVLEATACGCLCIGFDGIGGKDFIVESGPQQNFVLVESMNFIQLSKALAELVNKIKSKDPGVEAIRQNAIRTTAEFSPDCEKKSILEFWKTFFDAQRTCDVNLQSSIT